MRPAIVISPGLPPLKQSDGAPPMAQDPVAKTTRRRLALVGALVIVSFGSIAGQLARLGMNGDATVKSSIASPLSQHFARPNIVDRKGRLLATDVLMPSLFADPALIIDVDEVIEQLSALFPDLSEAFLRASLRDRSRRFIWLRRGLTPGEAQKVHDLGLPGLAFRRELRRIYPAGAIAGHVLGTVNLDNKGIAGVERYIDEEVGVEPTHRAASTLLAPVILSLDLGVQHGVRMQLADAMKRYKAKAASALVLDVRTGEIIASVSLPGVDPRQPADRLQPKLQDRLTGGTYELGSIFKTMSVAMALEAGLGTLNKTYDITQPVMVGRKRISDTHGPKRALTMREIFLYSSNVGAALIGLEAGASYQKAFLQRLGVLGQIRTQAGPVARPVLPKYWNKAATTTISYGHGLAVAPLQFAAAAAALVNGGIKIKPTFLPTIPQDDERRSGGPSGADFERKDSDARSSSGGSSARGIRVLSARTSMKLREIMRLNVTSRIGTGKRARARGYRVGGKTGTAEIPGKNGYAKKAVISSFLAAFPMNEPKYLTLVSLFEPQGTRETRGAIAAGVNAAPATARLITHIAPLLGVLPRQLN